MAQAGAQWPQDGPPRKVTAVGTVGEVGQLFTVYEKNWKCGECGQENYARRTRCFRCRNTKPEGGGGYVMDPALTAAIAGGEMHWKEAIDPASYQIYYYNEKTGETTWERPTEMGPAPHATGWFGRGAAGSVAARMYHERNEKYLKRPARQQKEFIDPKKYHLEGANEYNIWYGRYLGDHWELGIGKDAAESRCALETDAGYTQADVNKDKKDKRYFCIHFARGSCAKGKDCQFFHRIPTMEDDSKADELYDCFGRERHSKHRDDMGGVGSFMKPSRTLYVGGLLKNKYEVPQKLEEALYRHFGEWGEVENVNVIYRLSIAFVRYRLRSNAEFGKEAMGNQTLDAGEILNIRWAHDDPNPIANDAAQRADQDALYALLQAKGFSLEQTGYQYPAEYTLPQPKPVTLEDGTDITRDAPELVYPNTDSQYVLTDGSAEEAAPATRTVPPPPPYTGSTAPAAPASSTPAAEDKPGAAEVIAPDTEKRKQNPSTEALDSSNTQAVKRLRSSDSRNVEEEEDEEGGTSIGTNALAAGPQSWTAHIDPDTGATYFYNDTIGESSWDVPPGYVEPKPQPQPQAESYAYPYANIPTFAHYPQR